MLKLYLSLPILKNGDRAQILKVTSEKFKTVVVHLHSKIYLHGGGAAIVFKGRICSHMCKKYIGTRIVTKAQFVFPNLQKNHYDDKSPDLTFCSNPRFPGALPLL